MFKMGMNNMITSHGLLPLAVQIFAHIITNTTRFARGTKNRMIIHVAMPATSSKGMS